MELSSPKLKRLIIFQEELPKPENKIKKKTKHFLTFYNITLKIYTLGL